MRKTLLLIAALAIAPGVAGASGIHRGFQGNHDGPGGHFRNFGGSGGFHHQFINFREREGNWRQFFEECDWDDKDPVNPVPLPAGAWLLASGFGVLALKRRKKKEA